MGEKPSEVQVEATDRLCSFCGRADKQVSAMVRSMRPSGQPVYICNECVSKYTRELADDDANSP